MKSFVGINIDFILFLKMSINIILLLILIIISYFYLKNNNNLMYINLLRILLILYIIISLSFDIFLFKNYKKLYIPFTIIDIYILITLLIFIFMKNIIIYLGAMIFFPLTIVFISSAIPNMDNLNLIGAFCLSIFLIIMWLYTFIIIPIFTCKYINILRNKNKNYS